MQSRRLYYGDLVNRAAPLNRGLVSWWLCVPWYMSGPRFVDIAGRNHGTLTNGPTWSSLAQPGSVSSLKLTAASSQYVTTPLANTFTDFTVAAWFYPTATTSFIRICDKSYSTGFWFGSGGSGTWGGGILEAIAPYGAFVTLPNNKWNFLAMSRAGTTKTIVGHGGDATRVTSTSTVSGAAVDATPLVIGADNQGGTYFDFFDGYIGMVAVYSRGLSAVEMDDLFVRTLQGYPNELNWLKTPRRFGGAAATGGAPRFGLYGSAPSFRGSRV